MLFCGNSDFLLVLSQPVRTWTALFKISFGFQNYVSGDGNWPLNMS